MTAMQAVTIVIRVTSPPPMRSKTHEVSIALVVQVRCSETVFLVRMIDVDSR